MIRTSDIVPTEEEFQGRAIKVAWIGNAATGEGWTALMVKARAWYAADIARLIKWIHANLNAIGRLLHAVFPFVH